MCAVLYGSAHYSTPYVLCAYGKPYAACVVCVALSVTLLMLNDDAVVGYSTYRVGLHLQIQVTA